MPSITVRVESAGLLRGYVPVQPTSANAHCDGGTHTKSNLHIHNISPNRFSSLLIRTEQTKARYCPDL